MVYSRYVLSFNDAKKKIEDYDRMTDSEFEAQVKQWASFYVADGEYDQAYAAIRKEMVEVFRKELMENGGRTTYELDLMTGIRLYELLSPESGFDIINANDDDVWRYISVNVLPDITFLRYPNRESDVEAIREIIPGYTPRVDTEKESGRIKKKRFYSHSRRIWLKTLWWYIHLGWQGDAASTINVLKNNGTNIISHFIERPGRGYRETLFRKMMLAYSQLPKKKDSIFRAAAKLNRAKCLSIEPELSAGGELVYSQRLFSEVNGKESEG